jgi:hypothetical protein
MRARTFHTFAYAGALGMVPVIAATALNQDWRRSSVYAVPQPRRTRLSLYGEGNEIEHLDENDATFVILGEWHPARITSNSDLLLA